MVEEWDDKGCEERRFEDGTENGEDGHALHVKLNEPANFDQDLGANDLKQAVKSQEFNDEKP